jgi:hypothetical protein
VLDLRTCELSIVIVLSKLNYMEDLVKLLLAIHLFVFSFSSYTVESKILVNAIVNLVLYLCNLIHVDTIKLFLPTISCRSVIVARSKILDFILEKV